MINPRLLFITFLLVCLCVPAGTSLAGAMKTYNYPEIALDAPASLNVRKWTFKEDFPTAGCCYIAQRSISVMVLADKFPDQTSIQNTMVKLSGVPLSGWKLTDQAIKDGRGWTWRKEYQAVIGDKLAYTVLGHGDKAAYLIILCADKKEFTANQSDYTAWHKSICVGKNLMPSSSNPGKPQ